MNSHHHLLTPVCFIALLLFWAVIPVAADSEASSISQHGITWTFSEKRPVGKFVNGEWWVVGPITLTQIDPKADVLGDWDVNGSMVNPVNPSLGKAKHGLEGRSRPGIHYNPELNIAKQLPMTLDGNRSILSVIHQSDMSSTKLFLKSAAVLTVLDEVPQEGSFRPPYFGTDKPLFNESQLNYNVFRRLAPTKSAPSPASLATRNLHRIHVDLLGVGGAQANSELCYPEANNYGREMASNHNDAALALNLDVPDSEKRDLLIQLVQRGIDVYGGILAGFSWDADGGHRMGRKVAMYIAGKALVAPEILHYANTNAFLAESPEEGMPPADYDRFQEAQQHFIVSDIDIATGVYDESQRGMPEWKARATTSDRRKQTSVPPWDDGYRRMNGARNTGVVLIMTLMGDRSLWNDEAMFRYITERYWPNHGSGGGNTIGSFTEEMWTAYFDEGKVAPKRPSIPTGLRTTPAKSQ